MGTEEVAAGVVDGWGAAAGAPKLCLGVLVGKPDAGVDADCGLEPKLNFGSAVPELLAGAAFADAVLLADVFAGPGCAPKVNAGTAGLAAAGAADVV